MSFSRDDRGFGVLGGVPLAELFDAPARFGADPALTTPAYVYDLDGMVAEASALDVGFGAAPHLIAFAVKANSAGPIAMSMSRDVLPTPLIEILSAGTPHASASSHSPPDTTSAPRPLAAKARTIGPAELAFTANAIR